MGTTVFLSYTQSDEAVVERVRAALREADIATFFAPTDLSGGEQLSKIHNYIERADTFVVAVSQAALNSKWVLHELNAALAVKLGGRQMTLIPMLLERGPTSCFTRRF
jgi:hypothetical protein